MFQFNPFTGTLDLNSGPGSYADDVVEFANKSAFPVPGEQGKLYVDKFTDRAYRWPENGTTINSYREVSASEVTSAELATVQSNLSNIAGTAYKLTPYTHTVTASSSNGDSVGAAPVRAQAWTITFAAPRAIDFFLPAAFNAGSFSWSPQLGDLVYAQIQNTGEFDGQWTLRVKLPDGSTLHTVTSSDSDFKKTNIRFVYDGGAWVLDKTSYHQHSYAELLDPPPDVATGYFSRSIDAASRPAEGGQAPHQVVLSNDTRLTNPRRTAFVTPPTSPTSDASGLEAGAMAYDGAFFYLLVPTPGFQSLRWARSAMSTTW